MPHDTAETLAFSDRIKSATAEAHRRLESLPISQSIVSPSLDNDRYAHYLQLMRDVVRDLELKVYPLITPVFDDLEIRRKLDVIQSDLLHIGAADVEDRSVFGGISGWSIPFAAGVAYVVEGSGLGGRFILGHVRQALGYDEGGGGRYFFGYGNATGQFWKRFLDQLTRFESETGSGGDIIAGADFAFNAIHRHFELHG